MGCLAAQQTSQRDNRIVFLRQSGALRGQRDFERPRNPYQVHLLLIFQRAPRPGNEPIHDDGIVFAGDDGESVHNVALRIPLLAEEGWRDSSLEAGAPGAKREPDRAKPQLMVSSAETFRRASIEASPSRAPLRATPSAPSLRS